MLSSQSVSLIAELVNRSVTFFLFGVFAFLSVTYERVVKPVLNSLLNVVVVSYVKSVSVL